MTNSDDATAKDRAWQEIFNQYEIDQHDFDKAPYLITATQIKIACKNFEQTGEKEPRILCTQTTREDRPSVFVERGLFVLPTRNGTYAIIRGEGYVDIPPIKSSPINYSSKLDFNLDTSNVGNSEMQHLDFAYAVSMVRDFTDDDSLVLTIRGRKYTPKFSFVVGRHKITAASVQTEVDSGYEGHNNVVLVEAKNTTTQNTIIRQLYYPYRQWSSYTKKPVSVLFFEKQTEDEYHFWEFIFKNQSNYNSIRLKKSARYRIATPNNSTAN